MTDSTTTARESAPLMSLAALGTWMASRPYLWQMRLQNADELARSTSSFGYGLSFDSRDILQLWRLGFLKADLISSDRRLRRQGFLRRGRNEYGESLYSDERIPHVRPGARKSLITRKDITGEQDKDIEPLFHPFRYFVLYHIDRVLRPTVHRMVALRSERDYLRLSRFSFANLSRWLRSDGAAEALERWNDIAALAIGTEPCQYERVVGGFITIPNQLLDDVLAVTDMDRAINDAMAKLHTQVDDYQEQLLPYYQQAGIERLEEARQQLCTAAERLDPNKDVHTLLRLVRGDTRLKLRGPLGGCMLLLTMAEILRRQVEQSFTVCLPEEDERGFGWIPQGVKQQIYGAERLLDGSRTVEQTFIRQFGLRAGLRLRWYAEGKTEFYALRSVFEAFGFTTDVDVIDLHGQVVEKGVLGFRQSLRDDTAKHVYSFVSLDADVPDNVRAVRKAVADGEFFGQFFISTPDFEFGNFTLAELEEILWRFANRMKRESDAASADAELGVGVGVASRHDGGDEPDVLPPDGRVTLRNGIAGCTTGKQLMKAAQRALPEYLGHIGKDEEWGIALMQYAWRHTSMPSGQLRPITEAVRAGFQARDVNYERMRQDYETDINTGRFVQRAQKTAPTQRNNQA